MEERMKIMQELYKEVSGHLEAWMKEDMAKDARPAAYSIDQAMMFMRTSFMWAQDAAGQTMHYNKNKAQMDEADKGAPPELEIV